MSSNLMPHAVCWQQDQQLIWTMVVANAITFLSYFSICVTLFYMARKTRRAIAKDWVFFLIGFGLFIVACGSTHLMEVVTTWLPWFWIDAWTNIVTAVLLGYVAVQFFRRAPELAFGINDYAVKLANSESEKAQIQDSLLSARKLEEWNRMSAVVTHEINNPLAAIQNLMFLIEITPGAPPDIVTMAKQSADEVRRIESLTRSTLGFFRQNAALERVNLCASAESVKMLLEPLMRKRSLTMSIESSGDCMVNAYSVETRQVLLNLVRNAAEATSKPGSQVKVKLTGMERVVEIVVEDQGAGIEPSMLPHLFQFGASTKGDRGNGLGLWVVKQLIEKHGGDIDIETKLGEGTRFTIHWPREFPSPRPVLEHLESSAGFGA